MRTPGRVALALSLTAAALSARPSHAGDDAAVKPLRSKVFAGYSLVTSDLSGTLHGGILAADLGVHGAFTIALDASHHWARYGRTESNLMIGPAFFLKGAPVQPFAQALLGLHRVDASHLGLAVGGGADVRLGERWSFRGEADYLWSHGSDTQVAGLCAPGIPRCFFGESGFMGSGSRLSFGLVYRSRTW